VKLLAATVLVVLTLGVGLAQASSEHDGEPRAQAAAKRILIKDDFYSPGSSRAGRGKVTFVWRGNGIHSVEFRRAPGRDPRDCGVKYRGTCTRSLKRRGTYSLVCTVHPTMRGSIQVR